MTEQERFLSKVKKTNYCWLFCGQTKVGPYRSFWAKKNVLAHVYSYKIHNGPILPGKQINHTCDNPICVNPDHLYAGTQKQNVADCKKRGRLNRNKGEKHGRAKHTEQLVLDIRKEFETCKNISEIARKYNINRRTASNIINRKTWKHI